MRTTTTITTNATDAQPMPMLMYAPQLIPMYVPQQFEFPTCLQQHTTTTTTTTTAAAAAAATTTTTKCNCSCSSKPLGWCCEVSYNHKPRLRGKPPHCRVYKSRFLDLPISSIIFENLKIKMQNIFY